MGNIFGNSLAAGTAATVKNVPLSSGAAVLPRVGAIFATPLAVNAANLTLKTPLLKLSADEVGAEAGYGSMAHRLAIAWFRGTDGSIPTYLVYENEAPSAVAATWTLTLSGITISVGVLSLYVSGVLYEIPSLTTDTVTSIGNKVAAAITADESCPVTAVNVNGVVTFTAKSSGAWGNGITIAVNQRPGNDEALPMGLTAVIAVGTTGALNPTFPADLNAALGTGDSANELGATEVVHGYGNDSVILDALSAYVGPGNDYTGLYSGTVARPFRSAWGNTDTGSAGLADLMAVTNGRKTDRTNSVVAKPGSLTHPAEIAAEYLGNLARLNNDRAEGSPEGIILPGVDPGIMARQAGQDWTTEYATRDTAVKAGISPLVVEDGAVQITNAITVYHPSSIPMESNAFRRMRDISITQNILYNIKRTFKSEKWRGFTVVKDKATVQNANDRQYARDVVDVIGEMLSLSESFMDQAWLYSMDKTIVSLKKPGAVVPRADGSGFDINVDYVYSGEGLIKNIHAYIDTRVA